MADLPTMVPASAFCPRNTVVRGGRALAVALGLLLAWGMAQPTTAHADAYGRKIGLGLRLGSPVGLDGKFYLSGPHALNATLGFGYVRSSHFYSQLSYNFDLELVNNADLRFKMVFGVGAFGGWFHGKWGKYNRGDSGYLGLRVPIGLVFEPAELKRRNVPIDFFFEFAPGPLLVPWVGFYWQDIAIGFRYYF